jgi:hypothetical protein
MTMQLQQDLAAERIQHAEQMTQMVELVRGSSGSSRDARPSRAAPSRKVDPPESFDGDRAVYETWRRHLKVWEAVNDDLSGRRCGLIVLQSLRGDAERAILDDVGFEKIASDDGFELIKNALDVRYRSSDDLRKYKMVESAFSCSRGSSPLESYIREWRHRWAEVDQMEVTLESLQASHLIYNANLTKGQKAQLFLQIDAEKAKQPTSERGKPLRLERIIAMLEALAAAHGADAGGHSWTRGGDLAAVAADGANVYESDDDEVVLLAGVQRKQWQRSRPGGDGGGGDVCSFCQKVGHTEKDCFTKHPDRAAAAAADPTAKLHRQAQF